MNVCRFPRTASTGLHEFAASPNWGAIHLQKEDDLKLEGKRVLIVEDEFFVALLVEETVRMARCIPVGPFTSLATALVAARRESFDLAVLDINLGGEMVYPLADELQARGVPFIFVTGYGSLDLPARFRDQPRLNKPYEHSKLIDEIKQLV